MISWIIDQWFWIALWWAVWYYIFLGWYQKQIANDVKPKVTPVEAIFMFFLAGFGPMLAICILMGKALALNNNDNEK